VRVCHLNPETKCWPATDLSLAHGVVGALEVFKTGPDAGMPILAGGVGAESINGSGTNTLPMCEPVTKHRADHPKRERLVHRVGWRHVHSGNGLAEPESRRLCLRYPPVGCVFAGDLAVFGGTCGNGTLASAVIGTSSAESLCGSPAALKDYYELFNPFTEMWTVGTGTKPTTPDGAPAYTLLP